MLKGIWAFALSLLIIGCNSRGEAPAEETQTIETDKVTFTDIQLKNTGIETGGLIEKEIASVLRANGRIDLPPHNIVSISVPMGGYLRSTSLMPGMRVTKGQVLATIEDKEYIALQQDYLTAKVQLEFDEKEYNRQQELNVSKASSDKATEQAKANYLSRRLLIRSLGEKLKLIGINPALLKEENISKNIHVYAPISGYVTRINANVGKYINPSETLFELVNPERPHLNLRVFEKDLEQLRTGQKLVAYTNMDPNKKYTGRIILVSPEITENGTAEVHCHLDNAGKNLVPGMYLNAEVQLENRSRHVINSDAVVRFEGDNYLFEQIGHGEFQLVKAEIGERDKEYTEIRNAAMLHDKKLVLKGAYALLMKLKNIEEED